jgi:heterodisulfide reductase subunit A
MSAALTLSEVGQPVTLVECEAELGGNLRWIRYGLEARFRPEALLENLLKSLKAAPSIEVLTETTVLKARGRPGAFQLTLKGPHGNEETRSFGSVIVATGGRIHQPAAFGYGEDPRVMTQRDLEWALTRDELDPKTLREVIMIQCVGSRDEEHPYCSRVCCAAALKNALRLLEANPDLRLFIFYRDIRAFGTLERYYLKAREMGGLFIPFDTPDPPVLEIQDGDISLAAYDPLVGVRVRFRPDRVILSTGIVPEVPVDVWAPLGVSVNTDGFLVEANSKFRPLDLQDGVYACGLALGPAFVGEAMAQGRGAALRAFAFLERLRRSAALPGVSVQESRCAACGLCVTACPYGARELDEEQDHAVIHSHLCQACGTCAAVCPNDATQLRGSTNRQILSAVDALFET